MTAHEANHARHMESYPASTISANELAFLSHMQMWGSDAYPIRRLRASRWVWDGFLGITGSPEVYRTKRAAFEAVERYISVLLEKAAGRL